MIVSPEIMNFSANKNFYDLCKLIQTTDKIKTFDPTLFFFDKSNNKSWEISLSLFDLIFNKNKRIPGITIFEYLSILKILFVRNSDSVESLTNSFNLKKLFWEPFTIAVMNTSTTDAKAKILLNVLLNLIDLCHFQNSIKLPIFLSEEKNIN